jgi:hypothetical protein
MKRIMLVFAVVILISACATTVPVENTNVIKIVDTGKAKDEAFDLSMRWMTQTFNSAKSVIEYTDKGTGTINGKGRVSVTNGIGVPADIAFSIIIDIKDSKARLSFQSIKYYGDGIIESLLSEHPMNQAMQNKFVVKVDEMTESYQKYITTTASDW